MKGYKHLSAKAQQQIVDLTAAGKSETQIARLLHVHRNTVYRVQRSLGLQLPRHGPRAPVLTPTQEGEVLVLLKSGIGPGRIAAKLGLRQHAVRKLPRKITLAAAGF